MREKAVIKPVFVSRFLEVTLSRVMDNVQYRKNERPNTIRLRHRLRLGMHAIPVV